ncbi:hypothetical protein OKW33_002884 [Paraburkholderia atlantica]
MRERDRVKRCAVACVVVGGQADVIADVEFARANLLAHPARHAVAQRRFDLRPGLDELLQETAEAQKLGVENGADPQTSAHFLAERLRRAFYVGCRAERAFGVRQQRLAVARQRESVRCPREQRHAERLLQVLDLQADGRLGQMQLHCGTREVALACHGDESPKKSQIHILILARLIAQLSITHWICRS